MTCQIIERFFVCSCSVLVAERTVCRRLISLICAGWLPHDNRFVGELPRSKVEGHAVAGCLIVRSRVLPPLSLLLPTHFRERMRLPHNPRGSSNNGPGIVESYVAAFHLQLTSDKRKAAVATSMWLRWDELGPSTIRRLAAICGCS